MTLHRPCIDCGTPTRWTRCVVCATYWYRGGDRPARWPAIRAAYLADHPDCAMCGISASEVDHVQPIRWGGSDEIANLQALCGTCHRRKTHADFNAPDAAVVQTDAPFWARARRRARRATLDTFLRGSTSPVATTVSVHKPRGRRPADSR